MLLADLKRNRSNTKGLLFIILFRVSSLFTANIFLKILGIPFRIFYKFFIQWLLCIDIPDNTRINGGLKVIHGMGLVVNSKTIIGNNVTLRHNTTIGNAVSNGPCPRIGNNVVIGANCVLIGNISVGDNSIVGAGSVVVNDVPPNSVVVGNPAKVIKSISFDEKRA